jgi:hypothetical protein
MPGTIFIDKDRTAFVTALSSDDLNFRKRDIDITRGDTRSRRYFFGGTVQTNTHRPPTSTRWSLVQPSMS